MGEFAEQMRINDKAKKKKKVVVRKINSRASLDRSPKKNWVEQKGGLPDYIRRIANHLVQEKGFSISHAIATAINAAKKMNRSGDLNFPGRQKVNPKSRAEAAGAVAHWEKMKKSYVISKGLDDDVSDKDFLKVVEDGYRNLSDGERVQALADLFGLENPYKNVPGLEISDEEFDELAAEVESPDDPDTSSSASFEVSGTIEKVDEEKRQVFGWASIAYDAEGNLVGDRQGDFLDDVGEVEKSAYTFVLESRDGGEMHVRKGVSQLVESFVSTPEKWDAMKIPHGVLPIGWWVGYQVTDETVWKAVKDGKYRMFSVHGRGTRKAMD
jgi:hypothetical protein